MTRNQFTIVLVINALVLLVVAGLLAFVLVDQAKRRGVQTVDTETETVIDSTGLPILWTVPHFEYTAHDGKRISNSDLKGQIWIADFFYTRCVSACPILTAQLMILQRSIPDPNVRFVSFTVDPEHDTPAVLAEYARTWNGDLSRWILLATENESRLRETAVGMRVAAQKTNDPVDPIMHSNKFILVDASGNVRGLYDSTDAASMQKLIEHARLLANQQSIPTGRLELPDQPTVQAGQEIYMALGCYACHTNERIAPRLNGLMGRKVILSDQNSLIADEAYIKESILEPSAKVIAGYPPNMPQYGAYLSPTQVQALVAYIASLPADSRPTTERILSVDPVCKMDVSVGPDTPQASYQGKTYYFCCESCKTRFEKAPQQFLDSNQDHSR